MSGDDTDMDGILREIRTLRSGAADADDALREPLSAARGDAA